MLCNDAEATTFVFLSLLFCVVVVDLLLPYTEQQHRRVKISTKAL